MRVVSGVQWCSVVLFEWLKSVCYVEIVFFLVSDVLIFKWFLLCSCFFLKFMVTYDFCA